MKEREIFQIFIGMIVLAVIIGMTSIINLDLENLGKAFLFAFVLIFVSISAKKIVANWLDSDVEHEIWQWSRFGFKPNRHLKKRVPLGIVLPLFLSLFSIGTLKLMTILTYETRALKRRAAKRFGHYSFTEMTDWHNALVGAAGIISILFLSFIVYWVPQLEELSKIAAFYAFSNLIPFSKLDGSQIFLGSRVLWATLAIITLIFTTYAFALV